MSSFLDFEGVYDKTKRYIVNNWSKEDFTQVFGAETMYNDNKVIESQPAYSLTIKAGEMRELGQFEAYIFTKHFVDREMYRAAAKFDGKAKESAEMEVNNAIKRQSYEAKTLSEIKSGEETPFMEKIRNEIRAEEIAKLANEGKEKKAEKVDAKKEDKEGEFETK